MGQGVHEDERALPRPDMRLLPPVVACWAAVALALRIPAGGAWWVAGGCGAAAVLAFVAGGCARGQPPGRSGTASPTGARRVWGRGVAAAGVCAAAGAVSTGAHLAAIHNGPVAGWAAHRASATVDLRLSADPQPRHGDGATTGYFVAAASIERARRGPTVVGIHTPVVLIARGRGWEGLGPGTVVRATGRFAPAEGEGAVAALLSVRGPPVVLAGPSVLQRMADRVRSGLRAAADGLPPDERGLLPSLVDGDTDRMPEDLREAFDATGLGHLVAVSGTNVSVVAGAALFAARGIGLLGVVGPAVAAVAVAGFVLVCRPEPSVLRAAAMGLLMLLAVGCGRRRQALPLLCAAVLLLLLVDPLLASALGFVLSVAATAGIVVLAPGWTEALRNRGFGHRTAEVTAVALAAHVAILPILALALGEVSLVAIPAGLAAEPAVAPATLLGAVTAAVATVAPTPAHLVAWCAAVPTWWLARVARFGARLPGTGIPWPTGVLGGLVAAAAVIAAVGCGRRLLGRTAIRRGLALCLAAVLITALVVRPLVPRQWPPPGWVMVACDVGQGDALALLTGPGSAAVVDAGPDPAAVDRCLTGLGIVRVPVLLLTHLHADHVEGVPGVLRGRAVGEIETDPAQDAPAEAARVRHWAAAARVPITAVQVDERRRIGAITWEALWPSGPPVSSSLNDASIVLRVQSGGLHILLTGDIEPAAQQALLDEDPDLAADVVKFPHHGSAYQDPLLLRAVRPRAAVISVGEDNPFGHPAPSALRLLAAAGVRTFRTDTDGAVAVVSSGGRLEVVTEPDDDRRDIEAAGAAAVARAPPTPGPPLRPRGLARGVRHQGAVRVRRSKAAC